MINIYWFLPMYGDSKYLGSDNGFREPTIDYLISISKIMECNGIDGLLLPCGKTCGDPTVIASILCQYTSKIRFLVALRPGSSTPIVAARSITTLSKIASNRIDVNIVPGDNIAIANDGIDLDPNDRNARYSLVEQWLNDFCSEAMPSKNSIRIFYAGSSDKSKKIASKYADTYLSWGEPPQNVAAKITDVESYKSNIAKNIDYGVRLHIIVRESDAEAVKAAESLLRFIDESHIIKAQDLINKSDSVGRKLMQSLHSSNKNNLWLSDGLWTGIGLVKGGAGTALVGSPDTIYSILMKYIEIGISTFIFSGYPNLEESYYFNFLLAPLLGKGTINTNLQGDVKF